MKKIYLAILSLLLLLAVQMAYGQTQMIFDYGSAWKYLDNGSNQGTAWSGTSFSDASWASGTGYFGYGDTWINTCVNACGTISCSPSCGTKYITTYFRKTINIANTNLYDSIKLSLYRDDGMVVYVNGVEVWRDNMPTGTITYTSLAPAAIGGTDETTPITKTIPISYFTNGNNTIAVELHQQSGTSSDLTFNMQAVGILKTMFDDYGSTWKYLDNGSNQGTAWRNVGFNDAAWASASGFFGYGDTWITKCVNACGTVTCSPSCTNKYITTYFRKIVNIADPSVFDSIRFSIIRDDGFVLYVNGVEVGRDNLPTGTISYNTLAPVAIGGSDETTAVVKSVPMSYFVVGDNTIAVELHQQSGTSSDLGFNAQIKGIFTQPAVPVTLSQGPYLNMGGQTAVNVRWRTNVASKSRVRVGTTAGTYSLTVNDAAIVTEHEVRVTGLNPDTKYYYQFGTDTSIIQGDTTNFFVTAPLNGSSRRVTIAAFGDCGRNDNSFQTSTLTAYQNYLAANSMKAADMMLLIGDNAYDAGTDAEFSTNFFSRYSGNVLKNHMLFPCPGNHDYANNTTRQADHNVPYYSLFSMPTAGESGGVPSGTQAYYSYDWGNVHFLSLDSYGKENAGTTRLYDTTGAQVTWIKNDLAANTKKWTIAYWHHPPFTKGSHNSDSETELINIRQNFIRILERYGVDMIICGHSHDYERSYLLKNYYGTEASFNKAAHTADSSSAKYDGSSNSCPYITQSGKFNHGTVYVVSGSAGADGGVQSGYPHDALPYSIDDGGMFFIDVQDNRLDAKFIRRNNTIGDKFTIMKDVKVRDTVTLLYGNSVNLSASWVGAYAWAPGVTTQSITVTPLSDTLITVKDSLTNTCINDQHYIDVQCTMPAFTSCPGDMIRNGCDATIAYAVADTGRPAPVLTYAFGGATSGGGAGSGSGSLFNVGVTTVTITATNNCGSATCNFTVTVDPLPVAYNVIGGGGYCAGASGVMIGLDGSETGVSYQLYDGASPVGATVAGTGAPIDFGVISTASTYSVLATQLATSCTNDMAGSKTIFVQSLPSVQSVTGGGSYCVGAAGVNVGLDNSEAGISYQLYDGATAIGGALIGTGSPLSFGNYTAPAIYTVTAVNTTTGCLNGMTGTATVSINPLPTVYTITGGGSYCAGDAGVAIGLDNSQSGTNYTVYNGSMPMGSVFSGAGGALSLGLLTSAATYSVVASDIATGCMADMIGSATVVVNPTPLTYNVSGGGSYCAGGAGVVVVLAGSETGISYQLFNGTTPVGSVFSGTGTPLMLGMYGAAGIYTVKATNALTGCTKNMYGSATITVKSLPTVYSVTGGGAYCAGGTGILVGMAGTSSDASYQLYRGTTAMGAAIPGTGVSLSFGSQTMTGTYTVKATSITTGCSNNMTSSAVVSITPTVTPTVSLTSTGLNICAGTVSAFTAVPVNGGTAPSYEWIINGASLAVGASYAYSPLNGDIVKVKMTSSAACATIDTATNLVTVTVNPYVLPAVSISATPDSIVCDLTTITFNSLSANGGTAPIYSWIKNGSAVSSGTTYAYMPINGDNMVLSMSSNADCRLATTVYSNNVNMTVNPIYNPSVSMVVTPGTIITPGTTDTFKAVTTGAGPAPAFKWFRNSTQITGVTDSIYVTNALANNDSISCRVTGSGTCSTSSSSSVVIKVKATGVDEVMGGAIITIQPNPNSGDFTINGSLDFEGDVIVSIANVLGQEVYRGVVRISNGKMNERVSLSNNFPAGLYLLSINAGVESRVFRVTLQR